MEARKVMKIKNSFFINIPSSVVEGLKLEKGDVLWIGYRSGYGVVMAKEKNSSKISAGIAGIDRIRIIGDEVAAELRRKAKVLENSFHTNIFNRLLGSHLEKRLLDVERKVGELEGKTETLPKDKRVIRRLVKSKNVV